MSEKPNGPFIQQRRLTTQELHYMFLLHHAATEIVVSSIIVITITIIYYYSNININNTGPTYLSDKFHKVRDLHSIYICQATADNLSLPKFKLAKAQKSFSFKGAKLWNSLPISIKSSTSLSSLKRNLLKHLRNPVK